MRLAGYAGMPRERWEDWRQVAETFVAERRCSDPPQVVEILALVLRQAHSWTELLAAEAWVMFAFSEVYVNYVPGYGAPRTYQLLDRFVRWLHERGDIDEWRMQTIQTRIDEERRAHGHPGLDRPVVRDLVLGVMWDRVVAEFAATLSDDQRDRALSAVGILKSYVEMQHGDGHQVPMGAIDPDLVIRDVPRMMPEPSGPASRDVFSLAAQFYRWARDTDRMERSRADAIASAFAAAALGATG